MMRVTARIADPVVDVILVGDSVGNVCLGFDDHFTGQHGDDESPPGRGRATGPGALLVADMPFLSFHLSSDDPICNARGVLQRGADASNLREGQAC
ncbi:3-methyl-2-oxobutanoate hydroxymethyltransferase [Bradyrhizobium sp. 164]|nr:3-methyl-2-oxobutanoate hydroxymethyltransferase [Bradyrhizobium sp. 164]